MKKCSRSVHHSLTELNITPLLDLAFVLLVIFIITTIPPVNDKGLILPKAPKHLEPPIPKANYITVQANGIMHLNDKEVTSPDELLQWLDALRTDDPDLNVIVRGDGQTKYKDIRAVLDICQRANVLKVELATEPLNK